MLFLIACIICGGVVGLLVSLFVKVLNFFNNVWSLPLPNDLPTHFSEIFSIENYSWKIGVALFISALIAGQLRKKITDGMFLGPPDIVMSVQRGADLDLRSGAFSVLTALNNLCGGASVGMFGPIILLGALVSEALQKQILKIGLKIDLPREILLGAGVSASISALFFAPIGGLIFPMESILRRFSKLSLMANLIAALTAYYVARSFFEFQPLLPNLSNLDHIIFQNIHLQELIGVSVLGVCAGCLSLAYMQLILISSKYSKQIKLSMTWQPLIPALILFALSPWLGHLLGIGIQTSSVAMTGLLTVGLMFALLICKLLITPTCLSLGFTGGMVGPAIFLGAMLGGIFQGIWPFFSTSIPPYFSVIAAAACVAPVVGAPIATVIILWEMTQSTSSFFYSIICVSISYSITRNNFGRSLFDRILIERGVTGL